MEPKSKEFSYLLRKGLKLAEDLAGDLWTDFNAHDPGVTILEQLCYAITDLGYRTDYDLKDILALPPGKTAAPPDTQFTGDQILTCRPLLGRDFSALLFDQIVGVKNAWLVPSKEYEGAFDVLVEIFQTDEADAERILEDVWEVIMAERNFGEDIGDVIFLDRVRFHLKANIEIDYETEPASLLAQVIFDIQNKLLQQPSITTVDALIQSGFTPDEIFEGPLLSLGIYADENLRIMYDADSLQNETIEFSQVALRRIIRDVRGVKDITEAEICQGNQGEGQELATKADQIETAI